MDNFKNQVIFGIGSLPLERELDQDISHRTGTPMEWVMGYGCLDLFLHISPQRVNIIHHNGLLTHSLCLLVFIMKDPLLWGRRRIFLLVVVFHSPIGIGSVNGYADTSLPSSSATNGRSSPQRSATPLAAASVALPSIKSSSSGTSSVPSIDPQQHEIVLGQVYQEYLLELQSGFDAFGPGQPTALDNDNNQQHPTTTTTTHRRWTEDDDFIRHCVGQGNAGPDEGTLFPNGDCIFQTVSPVFTEEECDALIAEAKQAIARGLLLVPDNNDPSNQKDASDKIDDDSNDISHSELGEARVSQQLPLAREWLRTTALPERLLPLLASRFGIPAADLTLQDGLIIGYGHNSPAGSRSQPIHRDSCLLSLNVALSPRKHYNTISNKDGTTTTVGGGGTFFEGLSHHRNTTFRDADKTSSSSRCSSTLYNERGHVLCHASGIPHAGRGLDSGGERWVLVLFCLARNHPELARRCHAKGMIERDRGDLDQAERFFRAGLSLAPRDHLLLTSLGSIFMARHEKQQQKPPNNTKNPVDNIANARMCLAHAALGYPHCPKANMALGRMMLTDRRPRAALRRYDAVLNWLDDRDLPHSAAVDPLWEPYRAIGIEARVYGAQAALVCCREAKHNDDTLNGHINFARREQLERAIERINVVQDLTPNNPRLAKMMEFANGLRDSEL